MNRKMVFLFSLLLFPLIIFCQTEAEYGMDNLFSYIEVLYSAVIILGGYLSKKIPFLNKIDNGAYRVFAWALLSGLGFIVFGAPAFSLALTYFASTSMYELLLKPFKEEESQ